MDPMTISLIASAVLGYAKQQEQHQAFKDSMTVEAKKERFGGFTGEHGENGRRPSSLDPMFQSLMTGAAMGQNLKKAGFGKDGTDPKAPGGPTTADQPMGSVMGTGRQPAAFQAASPYSDTQGPDDWRGGMPGGARGGRGVNDAG